MTRRTELSPPYIQRNGETSQLIVSGEPFLMLGGELQNSSFSCSKYMNEVYPKLAAANLNTVLASVSWEQIEPEEGCFDFKELDCAIIGARQNNLRLVLLWFGSFKNGKSTYVPSWIKTDPCRFPRAQVRKANDLPLETVEILSVFATEAQKADAKAFRMLMSHLREIDGEHSTVIMVQVENEIGLLGDSRDRSILAEEKYRLPVPDELLQILLGDKQKFSSKFQTTFRDLNSGSLCKGATWGDLPVDRDRVDELFMAYHYCQYVEFVASSGKKAFHLPLYTNVWQNYGDEDHDPNVPVVVGGGGKPGSYPSGGGVEEVLDIWQLFVPSLDFIAPDIYLNDYSKTCRKYRHRGQPLFIPEQRRDEYGARRVWHAFGSHACLGTAPFGIDTLDLSENPFRHHYGLLRDVSQHILRAQAIPSSSIGFFFDEISPDGSDPSPVFEVDFGTWHLRIERSFVFGTPAPGSGMVIRWGENQFLLIGWGFQVSFTSRDPGAYFTGILKFEEKEVVDKQTGEMRTRRLLNGDETRSGQFVIMPSTAPDYGGFPICVTIPARTGIALCEPYALVHK